MVLFAQERNDFHSELDVLAMSGEIKVPSGMLVKW